MNKMRHKLAKSILSAALILLFLLEILPAFPCLAKPPENGPLYDADSWCEPFDFFDDSNFVINRSGMLVGWGYNRLGVFRETNEFLRMIPPVYYPYVFSPWPDSHLPYISPDSPLKIAEHAVQAAPSQEGLLILKDDHTLWSWNQLLPDAELIKIAGGIRYCSEGILITDDNRALSWDADTLQETPSNPLFQIVSEDAAYAVRDPQNIFILNSRGRLLRFPYEIGPDGTYVLGRPVTVYKNVKLPY